MSCIFPASAKRFALLFIVVLVIVPLACNVHAQPAASNALASLLQATQTLQADFEQRIESAAGEVLDQSSGSIYLRKPSHLRWDVLHPLEQRIVVDGDTYYQYDQDIDQLIIDALDTQLSALPTILLSGDTDTIEQHYRVTALPATEQPGQSDAARFELRPVEPGGLFVRIELGFNEAILGYMLIEDDLAQITRFEFARVRVNEPLAPSLFVIEPGATTDVIRGQDDDN